MPIKKVFFINTMLVVLLHGFMQTGIAVGNLSSTDSENRYLWQSYMNNIRAGHLIDEPRYRFPYESCFRQSAKRHQVPLTLLLAIARGESDFDPKAGNLKKGHTAFGVMQIQWLGAERFDTAKELGFKTKEALFKPCKNIDAGAKYLAWLFKQFDQDIYQAVAAYNVGIGNIRRGQKMRSAQWYNQYIYHHLAFVTDLNGIDSTLKPESIKKKKGRTLFASQQLPKTVKQKKIKNYQPAGKLPIIRFIERDKAERFIQYVYLRAKELNKKKNTDLKLGWFKTGLGDTFVVLQYLNLEEKKQGLQLLKKIGYTPYMPLG